MIGNASALHRPSLSSSWVGRGLVQRCCVEVLRLGDQGSVADRCQAFAGALLLTNRYDCYVAYEAQHCVACACLAT